MKTYLVLSPHSDDAELAMGATMAAIARVGNRVVNKIFSYCDSSALIYEAKEANLILRSEIATEPGWTYKVRHFNAYRQGILEDMIDLRNKYKPDFVFCPSSDDLHQDHQVITAEARRAFKHCTLLGYELPWNCTGFKNQVYSVVTKDDLMKKVAAIRAYKSQDHRIYTKDDKIWASAAFRGTQGGVEYAECFEVFRIQINLKGS